MKFTFEFYFYESSKVITEIIFDILRLTPVKILITLVWKLGVGSFLEETNLIINNKYLDIFVLDDLANIKSLKCAFLPYPSED